MKILTHIFIGLFIGTLLYYFLDLDFKFILISCFAAFIPDIDWRMQYSWGLGKAHRKVLHNVWALVVLMIIIYLIFKSLILIMGAAIGFITHLLADSFTVVGVYWLYPVGRKSGKFRLSGSLSMNTNKAKNVEKFLQFTFFSLSGLLLIMKFVPIEVFSIQWIIMLLVVFIIGYLLFRKIGKAIERIIRKLGL